MPKLTIHEPIATLNRRDFLSSTCVTATTLASLRSVTGCAYTTAIHNDHIVQILGDYLAVGQEHQKLVENFIADLRYGPYTTEGPEETARILVGARGQGEAERYVIQEFIRFSNYRMWVRRADQHLGLATQEKTEDA
ncbi:MAG: hypothetical protein FJ146_14390 [Deltaproteobacteria bacterium]|nr:hypothetical protein [Deltaproteobacteria bacterium]